MQSVLEWRACSQNSRPMMPVGTRYRWNALRHCTAKNGAEAALFQQLELADDMRFPGTRFGGVQPMALGSHCAVALKERLFGRMLQYDPSESGCGRRAPLRLHLSSSSTRGEGAEGCRATPAMLRPWLSSARESRSCFCTGDRPDGRRQASPTSRRWAGRNTTSGPGSLSGPMKSAGSEAGRNGYARIVDVFAQLLM